MIGREFRVYIGKFLKDRPRRRPRSYPISLERTTVCLDEISKKEMNKRLLDEFIQQERDME